MDYILSQTLRYGCDATHVHTPALLYAQIACMFIPIIIIIYFLLF